MAGKKGKKLKRVMDPTLAKAFTHPLRGHVWVTLFERGVVSASEIADELEIDVTEVSYHFRKLRKKNLIRLVRTEQRRGFDEHFYEPVAPVLEFDDEEWMALPVGVRESFSGELVRQVIDALTESLGAGCFDARSRHLSRTWLQLDERGWDELMRTFEKTLEQVRKIQRQAAERCKRSSGDAISVEVSMAAFETAASIGKRQPGETESL